MCAEQVTPAVMPAYRGYSPWAYPGLVSCMDTTADILGSYPAGPCGGFGPSVFGGGMPFCGMPGMYGMGGYGMGPWSELMGMTAEQSMDYTNRIRSKQLNQGVELSRQTQDADHRASIRNKTVAEKAAVLQGLIKENNQDQVAQAYENLKEAVAAKIYYESGKHPDEHDVETATKTLYAEAMKNLGGGNIPDDLRKYGDAPFLCGFKKAFGFIGWLFMDKKSSIENIAEVEGTKIPKSERAKEIAGGIVSIALTVMGGLLLHKAYKGLGSNTVKVVTGATKNLNHEAELAKIRPLLDKYKKAAMRELEVDSEETFHALYSDSDLAKEMGAGDACKAYQALLDKKKTLEAARDAAELKKAGISV